MIRRIKNKLTRIHTQGKYLSDDIGRLFTNPDAFYKSARGARILIYHGICLNEPTRFNNIFITRDTFEEHLKFYTRHFNVVSLEDYWLGNFDRERFNVCLTFDDGYANNHKYVLPFLEKYKVPASFYITGISDAGYDILWNDYINMAGAYGPAQFSFEGIDYIRNQHRKYVSKDSKVPLSVTLRDQNFYAKRKLMDYLDDCFYFRNIAEIEDYWKQMTTEQIRELSVSPYVTIGGHGYYHNDLAAITAEEVAEELTASKKYLESITNRKVDTIAFPYGSYSKEVIDAARNVSYTKLLAMDFNMPGDKEDNQLKERLTINPYISVHNQMNAIINGKYY
ncbi:MAG: polysaccharide deacetylase family protein [Taibaiella sp.]|nr:polysaccharide deacetylase family protein [Taibaiella sp.]